MIEGIEREIFFLKAATELIDQMVNNSIIDLRGDGSDTTVYFKTDIHQKYFTIMLVDFLSYPDKRIVGGEVSHLDGILEICKCPHFNVDGSIEGLAQASSDFNVWLDEEKDYLVHLSSISVEHNVRIRRKEYIKICGNISKHNFSRLSRTASDFAGILERNGVRISPGEALLALDDFYERFHEDILVYQGGTVTEFLNNIRWGIHEYLYPEFTRSFERIEGYHPMYKYSYPNGVSDDFIKTCYWDLMNEVRSGPYLQKFCVTPLLKKRY